MKHLESNTEFKINNNENEKQSSNNCVNLVESQISSCKLIENVTNITNLKSNTDGRYPKDDEDLIEQDLSDVEDNYEEPSVQRYLPGIFVDVKLKTKIMERYGGKIAIPMIVDFYSECLKKYGEEKNFIYEESYLENMRIKEDELWPELNKIPKITTDTNNDYQTQTTLDNKQVLNVTDQQKNVIFDENLDDVIWLKNRPNDPLLRCIRSITDRLNIQGIVGDPTSYLKKGGDDMHYDMDDPFFDDSAMLSELKMSKNDILLNRAMEREFSDWSEEEQDLDYTYVEPEDFVADYYSNFEKELRLQDVMEAEPKLFFDPSGWRIYLSKIPRQFLYIYYEFENTSKKITEPITDKMLRLKIKELLESIFKRLLKIQDFSKLTVKNKTSTKSNNINNKDNSKEKGNDKENNKDMKNETKLENVVKKEQQKDNDNKDDSKHKDKVVNNEVTSENFKKRGLNCLLQFRISDINGKILRWIVKSITSMTNCCSEYEIHSEWFFIVIAYNEKLISEHSNKIKTKLTSKLQSMKPKRAETIVALVSESSKTLSKSVGILRKLLKEHRDLTYNKSNKSSSKVTQESTKKKSLIEISLDSARDDHDEYMGVDQNGLETIEQDKGDINSEEKDKEKVEENKENTTEKYYKEENNDNKELEQQKEREQEPSEYHDLELDKKNHEIDVDKNDLEENTSQDGNLPEIDDVLSNTSNEDNSDVYNNQYLDLLETRSGGSGPEYYQETISPMDQSELNSEIPENIEYLSYKLVEDIPFLDDVELFLKGEDIQNNIDEEDVEIEKNKDNLDENNIDFHDKENVGKELEENTTDKIEMDKTNEKQDKEFDVDNNNESKNNTDNPTSNKDNDNKEDNKDNTTMDINTSSPKKSPIQKEDDLESILKQSKIMKRIKDISSLFRLVGSDIISLVQMNNLAVSVANKINNKEFKHVVEQLGLTHNPFDQTYKRVGEIATRLIQELYNIKVNIGTDIMKVVVINLQNHLKINELYEKKSKKPLLLFSNSKIKASPGRVLLTPIKDKGRKKNIQNESPKITNENNNEKENNKDSPKDIKTSPRRKNSTPPSQTRLSPNSIKDEGIQQNNEPNVKKKKTNKTNRVNSLKDLLLSRFSN